MEKRYNLGILEALFKDALIAENCTSNTRKNYLSDLRHFLHWMQWRYSQEFSDEQDSLSLFINLFTRQSVEEYAAYLADCQMPVRSANRKFSSIRRFSLFCQARGFISINPADNLVNWAVPLSSKIQQDDQAQCEWTDDELGDFMTDYSEELHQDMRQLCHQMCAEIDQLQQQV